MVSITIYPKNAKQQSLLKSLLEEMKIRFEIGNSNDEISLTEQDFFAKIDKSISQAKTGETKSLPKNKQKEFLGLRRYCLELTFDAEKDIEKLKKFEIKEL